MRTPPVAAKHPHTHSLHGDDREDSWHWLRERERPEVIEYLEAENRWCEQATANSANLRKMLYNDMLGRIRQTDMAVPYRRGPWEYFSRTGEGLDYPMYCRRQPDARQGDEEVMIDVNHLAREHDYCEVGVLSVSPDHRWLAFSVDRDGSEHYTLFIKNLETGDIVGQAVADTYYGFAWANDNQTFFYTTVDESHRPHRVYRLVAGQGASEAVLVFDEPDESFYLDVSRSASDQFIFIGVESNVTTEVRFVDANTPADSFSLIERRRHGVEYFLDHHDSRFLIITNDNARNFRLCETPIDKPGIENWKTIIPERDDVTLMGISAFRNHLVIHEQKDGLSHALIQNVTTGESHHIAMDEPVYEIFEGANEEFDSEVLRFHYTSLVTPNSVFDYNMNSRERVLLKQTEVLGGYSSSDYVSERVWVKARDGASVPVSLVHRRDLDRSKAQPMIMTAYGAYGSSYTTHFSSGRLCLLDRGIIFAIAHIRGGQEMGRSWYDDGKLLNKSNSFSDFVDCAEYVVNTSYTSTDQFAIYGGSAGGLLMGAVVNARPALFSAVVAQVPFVDVLTTIIDTSLPLSRMEWDEWGDPNDPQAYAAMKSWSPYDNVQAVDYPAMLVTAGLNDPRVSYWEPAKWVARMRDLAIGSRPLLLKTNMDAGHGGASGRYEQLEEIAFEYAFILDHILDER